MFSTSYLVSFGSSFLVVLATLLPILNPPSVAPIFLSLTTGASQDARSEMARRIALNVFLLLLGALLLGSVVLKFFGISLDIVRVGGGLLVVSIAWRLLSAESTESTRAAKIAESYTPEMIHSKSFFPLSFPITCGPGTLAATIAVGVSLDGLSPGLALVRVGGAIVGLAVLSGLIFFCNRYALHLLRLLGETGTMVFLRLSAFILLCVGVQIFWSGAANLLSAAVATGIEAGWLKVHGPR